jgi:hypothetical protein
VPILARTRRDRDPLFSSHANCHVRNVITKLPIVDNMTGPIVRIGLRFWPTRILVPFMSRDSRFCLAVSLLVAILTRSRRLWDLFLSPHTDSHVMSIITEFTVVFDMTGPVVRIFLRIWSTRILVPFVSWNPWLGLTVGVFMSVFTRSRRDRNPIFSSYTDCEVLSVITEFSVVNNVTGPIVRIHCRFWSPKVLVPFVAR